MDFKDYIRKVGSLSEVKFKILKTLWGSEDATFPKPWVTSSLLLKLTQQKYFDRRTRELRDELGCDIETAFCQGEHSYRLLSSSLRAANPRYYLTEAEKRVLFSKYGHACQICGKKAEGGVRGLQADHKIPLIRRGSHDSSNWQPICNECNVGKRGACEGCEDDCTKCPWAFPEEVGRVSLIRLPPEVLEAINQSGHCSARGTEKAVVELLRKALKL